MKNSAVKPGQLREYHRFGRPVGVITMVISRARDVPDGLRCWQCIRVSDGLVFEAYESGVPWCIADAELLVDVE